MFRSTCQRLAVAVLSLGLAAALPGCAKVAYVRRNAAAFFSSPAPAPRRVDHPFRPEARLAVLWIGHATALLQIDDKLVLTDPVFTSTVGQLLRRMVAPGLSPEALPRVDAVLVSHVHFDHLSLGSLEMIERKVGVLVVPQKGAVYVPDFAFETVELPTFATLARGGLRITAVPVKHASGRWGPDRAWVGSTFTGYVVEYHGISVYFGGDTAYVKADFEATRARFPNLDLALLPIAPVGEHDEVAGVHVDPRQALLAFQDLGARWMVPIHHDTFPNTTDAPGVAVQVLRREMAAQGVADDRVRALDVGEQAVLIPRIP